MKKFIEEFYNRFALKSPAFFQVIQWVSIVTAAVSGLPALLAQFQNDLGIIVPKWLTDFSNKIVFYSAIVAWIMAKLPVETSETAKPTTVNKMPFTSKKQEV